MIDFCECSYAMCSVKGFVKYQLISWGGPRGAGLCSITYGKVLP